MYGGSKKCYIQTTVSQQGSSFERLRERAGRPGLRTFRRSYGKVARWPLLRTFVNLSTCQGIDLYDQRNISADASGIARPELVSNIKPIATRVIIETFIVAVNIGNTQGSSSIRDQTTTEDTPTPRRDLRLCDDKEATSVVTADGD